MRTQATDCLTNFAGKAALRDGARPPDCAAIPEKCGSRLRIALLTPYNGGNLGDAAIQDAIITNLRLQLPEALFSGICLNCENFVERHGSDAFPLCANSSLFYAMSHGRVSVDMSPKEGGDRKRRGFVMHLKEAIKKVPGLLQALKKLRRCVLAIPKEIHHLVGGYCFVRQQDLLIVSGGGQLDEEWGGSWGHPFALFKWTFLARMARVPCAFVSVGTGKVRSRGSRWFLSMALRLACYRSYRDHNSRKSAATLLATAQNDPIIPDLAFGCSVSEIPVDDMIRLQSRSRTVVAISPIAYAKPGHWPRQEQALYEKYLQQIAKVVSQLVERNYFLVIVWSSLGDDESVIPQILERLDDTSKKKLTGQIYVPKIATWRDLAAILLEVDFLIASRLHSVILGFVTQTPTVAISFDPKVNWVVEDLGQTEYLLDIRDFKAEDVIETLDLIKLRSDSIAVQMRSYQLGALSASARQYGALAKLAAASFRRRN